MSLIFIIFIVTVIVTIFFFIDHIRSPFKSKEEPKYVPPVFPPVIAPLPEPEYVPVPGEIIPGVEYVNGVEINPVPVVDPIDCTFIVDDKPVEVELFPVPQIQVDNSLPEIVSPALNDDVLRGNDKPVLKKKQYYHKQKSKK
jgi:hypothetical protein